MATDDNWFSIDGMRKVWDRFGNQDPLWAILTWPDKMNKGWDLAEFLRVGNTEVAVLMERVRQLAPNLQTGSALDFGCGVGRLSQALCGYFQEVRGVDIAPSMIARANTINEHAQRCRYFVNDFDNLRMFDDETFDFVLSRLVLQHMRPEYSKRYLAEFVRVLTPGGIAAVQIPCHPVRQDSGMERHDPLPARAFCAAIDVSGVPHSVRTGGTFSVTVTIRNESNVKWPGSGSVHSGNVHVRVGNHWLDSNGSMAILDDARAELPGDLLPSAAVEIALTVNAPMVAGSYILEFDLVQEYVAWFKERGSKTHQSVIVVEEVAEEPVGGTYPDDSSSKRYMLMDGVALDEVVQVILDNGGEVLSIDPDESAPGWISYMYYARKK